MSTSSLIAARPRAPRTTRGAGGCRCTPETHHTRARRRDLGDAFVERARFCGRGTTALRRPRPAVTKVCVTADLRSTQGSAPTGSPPGSASTAPAVRDRTRRHPPAPVLSVVRVLAIAIAGRRRCALVVVAHSSSDMSAYSHLSTSQHRRSRPRATRPPTTSQVTPMTCPRRGVNPLLEQKQTRDVPVRPVGRAAAVVLLAEALRRAAEHTGRWESRLEDGAARAASRPTCGVARGGRRALRCARSSAARASWDKTPRASRRSPRRRSASCGRRRTAALRQGEARPRDDDGDAFARAAVLLVGDSLGAPAPPAARRGE